MHARWRVSILVLSTTVLASTVIAFGVQPSGPKAARGPAHGDGGVSAFYVWNEKVPGTPGRLLRQEPVPDHLVLTNAARGLRVLYTSTDGIDGKTAIAVSGAIYFPKGTAPAGGWPVIAWAHGTTGTRRCVRTIVDAAWAARHGLSECLAGGGLCGRRVRLSGSGHAWRTSLAGRAAGGLERARQRPVSPRRISGVGERCRHRRAVAGRACRTVRRRAGLSYAPTVRIRGTVATGVVGGPQYAASRRTSTFLFLILHKFQAVDPAFRPSDYLTEAGEQGFAATATTCPRPGVPTSPWKTC